MRRNYGLLVDLIDHGWEVKEFNAHEVTLVPKSHRATEYGTPLGSVK